MKVLGLKILILGVVVLAVGVVIATAAPAAPTATQQTDRLPPQGATYVGSTTCFTCHSAEHRNWSNTLHSKMIQDAAANPKAILADFTAGADLRTADGKAYAAADVTFTLGSHSLQRYIQKTDKGFQVLPGEWNVTTKQWVKADGADWLKDCAGCHTTGFDAAKLSWSETSVACEACHGPGSVHVDKAKALKAGTSPTSDDVYAVRQAIVKTTDAQVCAQCHNRGTSADKAHPYPVGYVVGGPLDNTMFIPVASTGKDDAFFWADGHEKKNYETYIAWSTSKHGNALKDLKANPGAADYCVGCHSSDARLQDNVFPQDKVTLKNAQFSITCVMCHEPHGAAGAKFQLRTDSYDLCTSCHNAGNATTPIAAGGDVHNAMQEMFEGQRFLGLGPMPSKHFANPAHGPVCATCHMPITPSSSETEGLGVPSHAWKIVEPTTNAKGEPDSCTTCHNKSDDSPEGLFATINKVQKDTKKQVASLTDDLKTIADAHKDWDPKSTTKSDDQKAYERASTLVSFVVADGSSGFHNPEYTAAILKEAQKVVDGLLK